MTSPATDRGVSDCWTQLKRFMTLWPGQVSRQGSAAHAEMYAARII